MEEEITVDGVMSQSNMKMDTRVLDVLMSEMTHGIVEINMILQLVLQDGLVMKQLENVLWLTQERVSVVNQLVIITVLDTDHTQDQVDQILIDAILQLEHAINVKIKQIPDVAQIEMCNAATVLLHHQIPHINSNVIKLMLKIQSVRNAQMINRTDVNPNKLHAKVAIQNKSSSNVIQKHSPVFRLSNKVISNRLVMLSVDTSPHKSFLVPGEVSWQKKANHRTSTWEKSI